MIRDRKYDLCLNEGRVDGLTWLLNTLKKIIEKGEAHQSYQLATDAVLALHRLRQYVMEAHELLHEKDALLHKKDNEIDVLSNKIRDLNAWIESLEAIVQAQDSR